MCVDPSLKVLREVSVLAGFPLSETTSKCQTKIASKRTAAINFKLERGSLDD